MVQAAQHALCRPSPKVEGGDGNLSRRELSQFGLALCAWTVSWRVVARGGDPHIRRDTGTESDLPWHA